MRLKAKFIVVVPEVVSEQPQAPKAADPGEAARWEATQYLGALDLRTFTFGTKGQKSFGTVLHSADGRPVTVNIHYGGPRVQITAFNFHRACSRERPRDLTTAEIEALISAFQNDRGNQHDSLWPAIDDVVRRLMQQLVE